MKIFLSDEIQNGPNVKAQPVIVNMNAEAVNRVQLRYLSYKITDEDLDAFNTGRQDYLANIGAKAYPYGVPDGIEIVVHHAVNYFRGDVGLEETVAALQEEMDAQ